MPSPQETEQSEKSDHSSEIFHIHNNIWSMHILVIINITLLCVYVLTSALSRCATVSGTPFTCANTMRFVPVTNDTHIKYKYTAMSLTSGNFVVDWFACDEHNVCISYTTTIDISNRYWKTKWSKHVSIVGDYFVTKLSNFGKLFRICHPKMLLCRRTLTIARLCKAWNLPSHASVRHETYHRTPM